MSAEMKPRKAVSVLFLFAVFLHAAGVAACAGETTRYEYKLVPLGSLTALQKKGESSARMDEVEKILNREGREGWEMVSIFAVRTTFDPNVFFAAMKRPLPEDTER
jgi:hypothetical protein